MADILMQLGSFQFAVDAVSYQSLKRSQSFRWSSQARMQRRPAQQFAGPGDETLDFSGIIYPKNNRDLNAMIDLRALATEGKPLLLVDGAGLVWGQWVIVKVDETQSLFIGNGWPRKQTFQLHLKHYGADQ